MSTDVTTPPDRDERGFFRPGNQVGKQGGNPHAKLQASHKRALMEAGSPEKVQKVAETLFSAACGGDVQAAKVLLDHWVGRPSHSVEISGTEGEPVKFNMGAFMAIITTALADHPEAQYRLAAALNGAKLDGSE